MLQFTKAELAYIDEHLRWCLKNREETKMTADCATSVLEKINQMLLDHATKLTVYDIINAASLLHSEDGEENREYDRALVELVRDVTHFTREQVIRILHPTAFSRLPCV